MLTVEARLVQWRRLYDALGTAEQRLRNAKEGRCTCGRSTVELQSEVLRLQAESECALRGVDAALAARKTVCAPV